jgi:asparagine N-glycosylation enzyme membrane subunit Stt3
LALLIITALILLFEFKIKIESINKINKNAIYVIGGIVLIVTSLVIYKQGVIKIIIPFGKYSVDNVLNVGGILYPTTEVSIRELYQTDIRVLYSLFSFGLVLAPLGIVLSIWKDRKYSYAVYLILFIIGTYSMLVKGGRFSLIMAVPVIIGTGLFFGKIYEIINEKVPKKKIVSVGVISMIILSPIILVPVYLEADKNNSGQREITDEWWEALNWVNENTPEDATIVTWWDFGYWIEAVGKRKTTMNGGHYNINARLVKTGNLFNTQSELVAMKEIYGFDVNCTKEEALEDLEDVREWSKDSKLAKKEKLMEMQKYADDNAYVIVDEKIASIYSWISYYGSWDYNKGKGEKTPIYKFYLVNMRQISDGVEYIYKSGETLIDVVQDYNNNFHASLIRDNKIIPLTGTLFDNNGKKNLLINTNGTMGIAYLSDIKETVKSEGGVVYHNTPKVLYLIEPEGVSKMFSRLMFFDGANLSYFELVQSFGSVKIYKVYKEPQENLNEDINYGEDEFFKKLAG